jgi:hypothetical protein
VDVGDVIRQRMSTVGKRVLDGAASITRLPEVVRNISGGTDMRC